MDSLGRILMVEDDPKDVELTLTALEEYNLANEVVVTRDGQEALDYLYCRGQYSASSSDNPAVLLLDLKLPASNQVRRSPEDDSCGRADVIPGRKGHDEKLPARGERLCREAGRLS